MLLKENFSEEYIRELQKKHQKLSRNHKVECNNLIILWVYI